jgi:hypothetical protein
MSNVRHDNSEVFSLDFARMLRNEAPWLKRPDSANSKRESLKSTRSIESLIGEILQKVHIWANFWPRKHCKKRISEFFILRNFLLLAYENFSTFNFSFRLLQISGLQALKLTSPVPPSFLFGVDPSDQG